MTDSRLVISPAHVSLLRSTHNSLVCFLSQLDLLSSGAAGSSLQEQFDVEAGLMVLAQWCTLVEKFSSVFFEKDPPKRETEPVEVKAHLKEADDGENAHNSEASMDPWTPLISFSDTTHTVLRALWQLLSPSCSHIHSTVASLLHRLLQLEHTIEPDAHGIVNHVAAIVQQTDARGMVGGYSKLSTLWKLMDECDTNLIASAQKEKICIQTVTQPWLWLLLSGLGHSPIAFSPHLNLLARDWLKTSITTAPERVLDPLFQILLHRSTVRSGASAYAVYRHVFDTKHAAWAMEQINIILTTEPSALESIMRRQPSSIALAMYESHTPASTAAPGSVFAQDAISWTRPRSYLQLLCLTLLKYLQSRFPSKINDDESKHARGIVQANEALRCRAAEMMTDIAGNIPVTSVSVQMSGLLAPQVLLTLAQETGINTAEHTRGASRYGVPGALPANASEVSINPVLQLQLLTLLRVLLSQSGRRTDFTDMANGSNAPTHPILAHELFAQTILAGLQARTLNDPSASPVSIPPPAAPIVRSSSSNYLSDSQPAAKQTISELSLLPTTVYSFFPISPMLSTLSRDPPPPISVLPHFVNFLLSILPLVRSSTPELVKHVVKEVGIQVGKLTDVIKKVNVATAKSSNSVSPSTMNVVSPDSKSKLRKFSSIQRRGSRAVPIAATPSVTASPQPSSRVFLISCCSTYLHCLRSLLFFCLSRNLNSQESSSVGGGGANVMEGDGLDFSSPGGSESPHSEEGGGLLTTFTSVFSSSKSTLASPKLTLSWEAQTRENVFAGMAEVVQAVLDVWSLPIEENEEETARTKPAAGGEVGSSAESHVVLRASARELLEGLLTRAHSRVMQAIVSVWSRHVMDLVAAETEAPSGSKIDAGTGGMRGLSAVHYSVLSLLHSLSSSIGSPDLLLASLIPLTLHAIASSQPHGRKQRAVAAAGKQGTGIQTPQGSPYASPSGSFSHMSPTSLPSGPVIISEGSTLTSTSSRMHEVTVISSLSEAEFAALHFLHALVKHTPHTRSLAGAWLNKDAILSLTTTSAKNDGNPSITPATPSASLASNGSLSQLYSSAQVQMIDHPLTLLWLLSILQSWIERSGVCSGGQGGASQSSSASGTSKPPLALSTASSAPAYPLLDRRTLRDIQSAAHHLVTTCGGFVGVGGNGNAHGGGNGGEHQLECMVPRSLISPFGIPWALLPPAAYFIAVRDELGDLLPPLPPWLDVLSNELVHPPWPHVLLTVPRTQGELNRLLKEAVPIATGSLLDYASIPAPIVSIPVSIPSAITASRSPFAASKTYSTPFSSPRMSNGKPRVKISLSLSLLAARCLSNVLATLLHDTFSAVTTSEASGTPAAVTSLRADSESRGVSLLDALLPLLFPSLSQHHPLTLPHTLPVVSLIASLSTPQMRWTCKAWTSKGWDHFVNNVDGSLATLNPPSSESTTAEQGHFPFSSSLSHPSYTSRSFFATDTPTLSQYRWLLSRCISEDRSLLSSFFSLSSESGNYAVSIGRNLEEVASQIGGGVQGWFGSKESELAARRATLKKLAFVLHSGRRDQYARYLSPILERIIENLKILPPTPLTGHPSASAVEHQKDLVRSVHALHAQVFLCLRVLLTRVSPEHLASIWPILLMELIRIFSHSKNGLTGASKSSDTSSGSLSPTSATLLSQACKFLDTALVLVPAQFALYAWMFVRDVMDEVAGIGGVAASGGAQLAASPRVEAGAAIVSATSNMNFPTPSAVSASLAQFEPHVLHLDEIAGVSSGAADLLANAQMLGPATQSLNGASDAANAHTGLPPKRLLRPVLLHRHAFHLSDLRAFHHRLAQASSSSSGDGASQSREPDMAFLDQVTLSDFVEYPEVPVKKAANGVAPAMSAKNAPPFGSPQAVTAQQSNLNVSIGPFQNSSPSHGQASISPPPQLHLAGVNGITNATAVNGTSSAVSSQNNPPLASPSPVPRPAATAPPAAAASASKRSLGGIGEAPRDPPPPMLPFAQLSTMVKPRQVAVPPATGRK